MRLLQVQGKIIPVQTSEMNPITGSDAESYAASVLINASGSEIRWGTREEDNRKIDLICSMEHPWIDKERLIIFVQVKSGNAYAFDKGDKLTIKKTTIKNAKKNIYPICLIWVNRDNTNCYWAFIHSETIIEKKILGIHHKLNPTIKYDLARCYGKLLPTKKGGIGITVNLRPITDIQQKRKEIKLRYKSLSQGITSPVLGEINFTKIGWRHMFRKSRSKKHKESSLIVIPYLEKLLKRIPSTHRIVSTEFKQKNYYQYRSTQHLLVYKNMSTNNNQKIEAFIRLEEEVRYPIKWNKKPMLSQEILRKVILINCYYK